jgi:hypothetical protein
VHIVTSGVAWIPRLDAMWREVVADTRWVDGLKVLVDHTRCDWSLLTSRQLEKRAQLLKGMSEELGSQRIALVVGDPADYAAQRRIAVLTDWEVNYAASVFTTVEAARNWLRQPPDEALDFVAPRPERARAK